jgi:agmatine/peptidylarginine deiminase
MLGPRGYATHEAQREFPACANVSVIESPVDDIWMRDIALTFALRKRGTQQEVVAIDWNFSVWGPTDARPARRRSPRRDQRRSLYCDLYYY